MQELSKKEQKVLLKVMESWSQENPKENQPSQEMQPVMRDENGRFISRKHLNQKSTSLNQSQTEKELLEEESKLTSVEYVQRKDQPYVYERTDVWSDDVKEVLLISLVLFVMVVIF